jgi:hypothetical protein
MKILQRERLICPPKYQQALVEKFGLNRFDEPNFRIAWGDTETTIVAGLSGYEERLLSSGACWKILRWNPPECYGSPESWYLENYDYDTGLCLLGPYPEKGRYEVAIPLMRQEVVNGKLEVEAMPLNYAIIDLVIPLLVKSQELSYWERKVAEEEEVRLENTRLCSEIADRMSSDLPAFYGPVSYAGQITRTALIDRKMAAIEENYRRFPHIFKNPVRGLRQIN